MKTKQEKGSVRIIGGKWRGRKLHFAAVTGLRPTKDLVRETLFNWLTPIIVDAVCLDCFAGSGALGFEALSRGAKYVLMVDQAKKVITNLKKNAAILNAKEVKFLLTQIAPNNLEMQQDDKKQIRRDTKFCARSINIASSLNLEDEKYNLVFLDPPFNQGVIAPVCTWLKNSNYLAPDALIYIEAEKSLIIAKIIPNTWEIIRHKTSGDMQYCLVRI